jgi:triosephosphate isomerase
MGSAHRRMIIAGNWKMHKTVGESLALVRELRGLLSMVREKVEIAVAPPFTSLHPVAKALEDSNLKLAAQNCHWEPQGAFTGEVSCPMLAKLDVSYVIVGHSERREHFGETDEMVNKKVRAVLGTGMTPTLCCGETIEEREAGATDDKVRAQVLTGFDGVKAEQVAGSVVAYEPIWCIGTGHNATPDDANDTIGAIRAAIRERFGADVADAVRIQYGGSVRPGNIGELMARPEIDGALVGGASLDPDEFARIVRFWT